ncbi:hypothetical protein MMYC01_208776 [Madurella mycetomatis]|uniref:Uncharacterized protein n=1 Tax=Madurella mycetomatis TaxID=100816 RepID=A0A175VSV1_9PEZI|nr:hypothetical protein MMYC01_208776 [Madurella mycetomatis]
MFSLRSLLLLLTLIPTLCLAAPRWYEKYTTLPRVVVPQSYYEVFNIRAQTPINPRAVTDVNCLDPKKHIISHDESAASLTICGGIAGSGKTKCGGSPAETFGRSGTALFTLRAMDEGQTINISKTRWLQCVQAAREACPTGSVSGTCIGGASRGNVGFTLTGV